MSIVTTGGSKMTTKLTPESPRWNEFVDALMAALDTWGCDGDAEPNVHHHAKRIMAAMGDIDIAATLASFEDAGGYCDCEILMNVDPGFWADEPAAQIRGAAMQTDSKNAVAQPLTYYVGL